MSGSKMSNIAREVLAILDGAVYKPQADIVLDAKIRELARGAASLEGELARARETTALQGHRAAIAAGAVTDDTREIESALVDALEDELEDYQGATKSWNAVNRALDGLRARDARIARYERLVAALEADAAAGNLDAKLAVALANYKGKG